MLAVPVPPDALPPEVADITAPPRPRTVDQVLDRLTGVHTALTRAAGEGIHTFDRGVDSLGQPDGLSCFNYLYTVITTEIKKQIDDHTFADTAYLTELDVAFAGRYLNALHIYASGDAAGTPASWRAIIEHRRDPHITPLQFAVAGVNAHVNFDLPFAVVTTCEALGTTPLSGSQHSDFEKVNDVFYSQIPALREQFEEPALRPFDRWFFRSVLNLFDDGLVKADREAAWVEALRLWDMDGDGRRAAEARLDRYVSFADHAILAADVPPI